VSEYKYRHKIRWRKRKIEGDDVADNAELGIKELQRGRDLGLLCRPCRKRVPWKELWIEYDIEDGAFTRRWFCRRCGHMVKEEIIDPPT